MSQSLTKPLVPGVFCSFDFVVAFVGVGSWFRLRLKRTRGVYRRRSFAIDPMRMFVSAGGGVLSSSVLYRRVPKGPECFGGVGS